MLNDKMQNVSIKSFRMDLSDIRLLNKCKL